MELALLKREAKAERRRIREEREAQRTAQELAANITKKPTRLDGEYQRGYLDGWKECKRLLGIEGQQNTAGQIAANARMGTESKEVEI